VEESGRHELTEKQAHGESPPVSVLDRRRAPFCTPPTPSKGATPRPRPGGRRCAVAPTHTCAGSEQPSRCGTRPKLNCGTLSRAMPHTRDSPQRQHREVTHDADGKPFRYRQGRLATFFWLARHPDRHNHSGLTISVWSNIALSLFMLAWSVFITLHAVSEYRRTGGVSFLSISFMVMAALFVYCTLRSAPAEQGTAAAIDLNAGTCPACGYSLQAEADGTIDATCSECGRRWTWPPNSRLARLLQETRDKRQREEDRNA
jgi:hypothetical protein